MKISIKGRFGYHTRFVAFGEKLIQIRKEYGQDIAIDWVYVRPFMNVKLRIPPNKLNNEVIDRIIRDFKSLER